MSAVQELSVGAKASRERPITHYIDVALAVKLLLERHGPEGAKKVVRHELQKSRRARSRRRFQFWTSVGARLGE